MANFQPASPRDLADLVQFLNEAEAVLENVVVARNILFRHELREGIQVSWPQIQALLQEARDELDAQTYGLDKALGDVGLSGEQLSLKLTGFRSVVDRFKKWGTVSLLKKLLGWLNVIFGSLAKAIPILESVKEYKEVAEKGIEAGESEG